MSFHSSLIIHHSSLRAAGLLALSLAFSAPGVQAQTSVSLPDQGSARAVEVTPALRDYCRMVNACGLKVRPGACPPVTDIGPAPYPPDGERCVEARELEARGLRADHPEYGFRLYRFLGYEYRVVYQVPDTLPISRARLEFLIGNVPLAAKLVSHYRKTPYEAEYTNSARTHFKGSKGPRLRGEARQISGAFAERRLLYLGSGTAEVAFWKLYGPAMMDFTYAEVPGKPERVAYNLKIVVYPGNGVINAIMNLGLFRSVVNSKVRDVLIDITETARLLQEDGGKSLLGAPGWTGEDREKVEALLGME